MDRSNTRNMRGGKARFVQRNQTNLNKSPRVTKGKLVVKTSAFKPGTNPVTPRVRCGKDTSGRRLQSPQLPCAAVDTINEPSPSPGPTEDEHASPQFTELNRREGPWCRCLLIMPGFEFYYLCYEADDGTPCAPVLTGKDGRILYCTNSAKIPRMLSIGREDLAALGEPDLGEMVFTSVPDALQEYRDAVEYYYAKNLNDVFDVLTELLAACACPYEDSILSFLLNCFCNHFNTVKLSWAELAETQGYRGLTVEEGIQLALGIVLTNGRHVA